MRLHGDFDRLRLPPVALQAHLLIDEAHETLHSIQDSLNLKLNSGSPRWVGFCLFNSD